jgi:hypothetical protein
LAPHWAEIEKSAEVFIETPGQNSDGEPEDDGAEAGDGTTMHENIVIDW